MTFPITYTFKMDVSGTAFGGTPSFTDFTSRVLPQKVAPQITDGRQDESSDVNPGLASFTLDNRDSAFTPNNASSPYYPHIKPGVRVRLEVTCNATLIEYFDGYVTDFSPYLDADRAFGLCDITVTDVLARLGNTVPLRDLLVEETVLSAPQVYVPMIDTTTVWGKVTFPTPLVNSVLAASSFPNPGTGLSDYQFGATGPPGATSGALTFSDYSPTDGHAYELDLGVTGHTLGATAFCAGVWFNNPVQVAGRPLVLQTAANEVLGVDISLPASSLVVKAFVGSTLSTGTSGVFVVNKWHSIGVQVTCTGTGPYTVSIGVYIDGTLTESTSASLTSNKIEWVQIGGQVVYGTTSYSHFLPGDYAHFALWTSPPSWSTLYTAGNTGFAGESTTTHATRMLSYRAPSVSLATSGVYTGTVGLHPIDGESVQQALFDTAHVEAAPLYADGAGNIVMLNRGQMTSPTTAVTLDASDGDLMATLRVRTDNQYLVNEYEITPSSGNVQTAQDTTSQSTYGYYSGSQAAPFASDSDAATVANDIITALKDPGVGASQLDVDLFALAKHNAALVASLLAARTGTVVALTNLPSPFSALTVMVQGRSLQFTTTSALLTLYTTPTGVGVANTPTGSAA